MTTHALIGLVLVLGIVGLAIPVLAILAYNWKPPEGWLAPMNGERRRPR